ncbi:MAG TPA: gluconokinase [Chryseolinea sp.]|nr:gluconokinase [Chryseolinea sp.]
MECIVTIELGTNAVRVIAFDLRGAVLGTTKGTYPTFHSEADYSEQDPEQIFITMLYVLKNFLTEKIHPSGHTVISICFSASMHSLLMVDKSGTPLGNAITWADNRAREEAQDLKVLSLGRELYESTGTPIHPMSPLVKIAWLAKHERERFNRTHKFLSIKSYVLQQLTSDYVLDYSLASATGLFNIHTHRWEQAALDYAGIVSDKLPELVTVFNSPGKLRHEFKTSLGLDDSVKIIVGSSDGCMATLGGGVWDEGKAIITIEDSGAVRTVGREVVHDSNQRVFNYLLTDNCYVSGGPTNNGGIIFEWYAKQFGDFNGPFDIEHTMQRLINEAAEVSIGADGLIFLPYLLGERAPIWNANARGTFFGINIKHEKKHFVRAVVEGIVYEMYSIGKMLQEYRTINSLTVNGSFASVPLCAKIIANIFRLPVSIGRNPDSIAQGAFLLAATEQGIYKSLDEAARSVVLATTYQPNGEDNKSYQKYFSVFEKLSTKLHSEFEELANLQRQ